MAFRIEVDALTFSDGTRVSLSGSGVVVMVGPNNAGKTAALRGIQSILKEGQLVKAGHHVLQSVSVKCHDVTKDSVYAWLWQHCKVFENSRNGVETFHRGTRRYTFSELALEHLNRAVDDPTYGFRDLVDVISLFLNAQNRLQAAESADAIDREHEPPVWPIQELLLDDSAEKELRRESLNAFGAEFVLCRASDKKIHAYWGKEPDVPEGSDRVSSAYLKELRRLPKLDDQGDGIRSYLGTLFHLRLSRDMLVFLDEPEAFLHPPQAYRLGGLVSQSGDNRQIFVATHSSDFLRGLTDVKNPNVAIVHIRRNGTQNIPKMLHAQEIELITNSPALRYSRLLDGLFHDMVVLCESENDCRFYHYVFDQAHDGDVAGGIRPEVLFADVGGKTGFPIAVSALSTLGVPVRVIADFDILNAMDPLRKTFEALGGRWADIEADWRIVKESVETQGGAAPLVDDIRKTVSEILKQPGLKRLDEKTADRLKEAVRYPSPWSLAKKNGRTAIPAGKAFEAVARLLQTLKQAGVFVVPVGELESWAKQSDQKSGRWLESVFSQIERGQLMLDKEILNFVREATAGLGRGSAPASPTLLKPPTKTPRGLQHSNKPNTTAPGTTKVHFSFFQVGLFLAALVFLSVSLGAALVRCNVGR